MGCCNSTDERGERGAADDGEPAPLRTAPADAAPSSCTMSDRPGETQAARQRVAATSSTRPNRANTDGSAANPRTMTTSQLLKSLKDRGVAVAQPPPARGELEALLAEADGAGRSP